MSALTVVLWFTGGAVVDGERRAGVVAPYAVHGSENVVGRDDLGPPSSTFCHGFNKPTHPYIKGPEILRFPGPLRFHSGERHALPFKFAAGGGSLTPNSPAPPPNPPSQSSKSPRLWGPRSRPRGRPAWPRSSRTGCARPGRCRSCRPGTRRGR